MSARRGAAGTFRLCAVMCAAGFLLIRARVPETNGKTPEPIERELCIA